MGPSFNPPPPRQLSPEHNRGRAIGARAASREFAQADRTSGRHWLGCPSCSFVLGHGVGGGWFRPRLLVEACSEV
eukprot:3498394-Alexandrium_andersonii.AAC.1